MALEYIFFIDTDASPQDAQNVLVAEANCEPEEDFRYFKCIKASGLQALIAKISQSDLPDRTFAGTAGPIPWTLSPKMDVFFSIDKNERYESAIVSMIKSVMVLLSKFSGDAVFYNNESPDWPILLRVDTKLYLTDHPKNEFWDSKYEPDTLSLVSIPFDFSLLEINF